MTSGARLAALVILGTLPGPIVAQRIFRGGTDSVFLPVTVTDGSQHLVGGLDRAGFHVLEDGVPQTITAFSRDPQPIALSMLLDTSTSMERTLGVAQEAAIGFARRLGPADTAQIITFDSQANIVQTFTRDPMALEHAIAQVHAGGSTSLYTALYVALSELQKVETATPDALQRQAVIVLSDGEDTSSLVTYDAVLDLSKRASVTVYAIGLRSKEETNPHVFNEADFVLRTLAQETGGKAYFVDGTPALAGVYTQIADELANQYVLGYSSTNHALDGAWRKVTVSVDRAGAVARTKSGYFGPKMTW